MADGAIFDLTQETVMTAAARIPLQETSGATRATSATYALMGGLEIESTYDTAANHADIAAAVGTLYLVNTSALTSDMNFTLPVAASVNTGERVGVHITVGDDAFEMDLKSGATGDLINGVDHSTTSWSRLFITGEVVIFRCIDGATGDWIVEVDGRIPCSARIYATANITTSTANVAKLVVMSTEEHDVGDVGDTANDRLLARRAAPLWIGGVGTRPNGTVADGTYYEARMHRDGSTTTSIFLTDTVTGAAASNIPITATGYIPDMTDGGTLAAYFKSETTDAGCLGNISTSYVWGLEVLGK